MSESLRVDAFASEPHYADHIAPVWQALDPEMRGEFYVRSRAGFPRPPDARAGRPDPDAAGPVLVASFSDSQACRTRPRILLEHGAGQSYPHCDDLAEHGSYSGGQGHDGTVLFLCPSWTVADRWHATYPEATVAVVGVPKLDVWHSGERKAEINARAVVAFAWHWDATRWCPEAAWAWPHYQDSFPQAVTLLRSRGYEVVGHAHPRVLVHLQPFYEAAEVEVLATFDEVMQRADVLCVDNSSVGMEFASTGRSLVWLNTPQYRRDVEHGGRFWHWTKVFVQCNSPDAIADAVDVARIRDHRSERARRGVIRQVYTYTDGKASERAAAAIKQVLVNAS